MSVLEDLIVSTDADRRQVVAGVELTGAFDGRVNDVVDGAQGQVVVEEVPEQFGDSAERTVPDENQTECELADPVRGDGKVEQHRSIGGWWVEGAVQGVAGNILLSVDEPPADPILVGQFGDRSGPGERPDGQLLARVRAERLRRVGVGRSGVGSGRRTGNMTHACFLWDLGAW